MFCFKINYHKIRVLWGRIVKWNILKYNSTLPLILTAYRPMFPNVVY